MGPPHPAAAFPSEHSSSQQLPGPGEVLIALAVAEGWRSARTGLGLWVNTFLVVGHLVCGLRLKCYSNLNAAESDLSFSIWALACFLICNPPHIVLFSSISFFQVSQFLPP